MKVEKIGFGFWLRFILNLAFVVGFIKLILN